MEPVKIKENLYQIPVTDWNVRDFHGYSVYNGTTYNAYLSLGEKNTLFDTAKKGFSEEFFGMISKIIEPKDIDYIVVNHAEPDHSGLLTEAVEKIKPEKIFLSSACQKAIIDHYHKTDWPFEIVKDGQEFSIGSRTVHFLETRMLHWPDSCFSYLKEDEILISSDAFGHHWASSGRYDDEVDNAELMRHSKKYFANILLPYAPMAEKLLSKVASMNLSIKMICPDHGVMWRKDPVSIINKYKEWSSKDLSLKGKKATIFYDTMWHSTEKMADSIFDGLKSKGFDVDIMNIRVNHRSDIMTQILDSSVVVAGSPTLNNGIMPTVSDMLCYMRGLKPTGKIGGCFGSYGWSGESVKEISEYMTKAGLKLLDEQLKIKYVPSNEDLVLCKEYGIKLADKFESTIQGE